MTEPHPEHVDRLVSYADRTLATIKSRRRARAQRIADADPDVLRRLAAQRGRCLGCGQVAVPSPSLWCSDCWAEILGNGGHVPDLTRGDPCEASGTPRGEP